ncbi:MAG: CPBP family intramembrane metalloprotease [Acidobacteria bacterium]|nr:CPBP family intramembrane metalloprotease [Acidobacteriota bacterium]
MPLSSILKKQEITCRKVNAMSIPWQFFALAYAISWAMWGTVLLRNSGLIEVPGADALVYAGAFGPCIAGLVCAYVEGRARSLRNLLRGILAVRQTWQSYGFALLLLPGLMAAGTWVGARFGFHLSPASVPMNPLQLLVIFVVILMFAGFGEEIGWRGYALPRMLSVSQLFPASLAMGFLWSVWHAPLFLIHSTVQHQVLSGRGIMLFLAFGICFSVLFTWLYTNTGGSLFMAILFHSVFDFASIFLQPLASELTLGIFVLLMVPPTAMIAFAWQMSPEHK